MAYNTKYFARIYDFDNKTVTLNLQKRDYEGEASEITHYDINPLSHYYRSANKEDDLNIHGSEIGFNFYSLESDSDKYDELFESELRDWKVEILKQVPTTISDHVQFDDLNNIGSTSDWSTDNPNRTFNTVSSIAGAQVFTNKGYVPLSVAMGDTAQISVSFLISGASSPFYDRQYFVGLMDSSFNVIAGSVQTSGLGSSATYSESFYLTATSADAAYVYFEAMMDWSSGNNNAKIKCFDLYTYAPGFLDTPYWLGWLEPENLSRKFVRDAYHISLCATDGLADLKEVNYTSTTGGTKTAISIIKDILSQTNLELPIQSQLNYKTNTIATDDSFISSIYLNTNRFSRGKKDGRTQYMSCYDSLTYILDAFNCKISQIDGSWDITQKNEINSHLVLFDWDTLTPNITGRNRLVNIDSYRSKMDSDELTKIRPIKTINLTFFNKNVGETTVGNGSFDSDISGWNNGAGGSAWDTLEWEAGRMHLESLAHNGVTHYVESDPFYLDNLGLTVGAVVNCSVDYELIRTGYYLGLSFIYFALYSGSTLISNSIISGVTNSFTTSNLIGLPGTKATVQEQLKFALSGNYSIRIYVSLPFKLGGDMVDAEFYLDNVGVVQQYASQAVYDKLYTAQLSGTQYGKQEIESSLYFSDGLENNSIGNIKYNATTGLTTVWTNQDISVYEVPHQYLYCYEKMKMNRKFKNNLTITLKASSENIKFNSILELDSKKYYIVGYRYMLQTKDIQLNLIELLREDFDLDFEYVQDLTSVDGQSTD